MEVDPFVSGDLMLNSREIIISAYKIRTNRRFFYLIAPLAAVFLHFMVWRHIPYFGINEIHVGGVFIAALVLFAALVHELIHYMAFVLWGGAGHGKVEIKINLAAIIPYVVCKVPVTAIRYKVSAILPFLVLGVIPLLIGILLNFPAVETLGILQIVGSADDVCIFVALSKFGRSEYVVRITGAIGFRAVM